jgi:ABC-type transporter Mla MlaB component
MKNRTAEVQLSSEGKTIRLVFPEDFGIAAVKAFVAVVGRALRKKPQMLVLDAAAMERVDGAALQALVVTWQAAKDAGISVTWQGCSANLVSAAKLVGLAGATGIEP